jgi:hypothetical protein
MKERRPKSSEFERKFRIHKGGCSYPQKSRNLARIWLANLKQITRLRSSKEAGPRKTKCSNNQSYDPLEYLSALQSLLHLYIKLLERLDTCSAPLASREPYLLLFGIS